MNKKILALGIVIISAQSLLALNMIKQFNLNKNSASPNESASTETNASIDATAGHLSNDQNNSPATAGVKDASTTELSDNNSGDGIVSEELSYDLLIGEMALSRQQFDVAFKEFMTAARVLKDPAIAKRATEIAVSHFDLNQAEEPARIWAKNAPKEASAQMTTAAILIRLNKPNEALPYLAQVNNTSPNEADRYFLSLYNELPVKEEQEMVTGLLLELQKTTPKSASTYIALAEIYLDRSDVGPGLTQIKEALELVPNEPKAILVYAELMHQKGEDASALEFLAQKLNNAQNNASLRLYYVEFLLENKKTEEAKAQLASFKEDATLTPAIMMDLARICMKNQWYENAETFLLKITQQNKDNESDANIARYFLGRINEVRHQYPEAISWFTKVEEGKFHINSYVRAAWLYSQNKETQKAIDILELAHPSTLEDVKNLFLAKADLQIYSENYDSALNLITAALQQIPDDVDLLYSRSMLAQQLNKTAMAEEDLKNILKIQAKNVDALNALGFLLADKTNRADEALLYLNAALEIQPNNPSVMDSMGWLQYKMGNQEQAVKWLQNAYNKRPDSSIAAHLSEVLWKGGQKEAANSIINKALEKTPGDIFLKETKQRIQQIP